MRIRASQASFSKRRIAGAEHGGGGVRVEFPEDAARGLGVDLPEGVLAQGDE
ncbi:hypothetical protein QP028_07790 [Corynebacterium suedekumii]|nr:hypothetical protein QP028_07790 [Corynebacterium suedekumii]